MIAVKVSKKGNNIAKEHYFVALILCLYKNG